MRRLTMFGVTVVTMLAGETLASAQRPAPAAPAQPPSAPAPAAAGPETSTTPAAVPTELTDVSPNGITADQVGARAAATSYSAAASEEALRGAAARVDAAWANFLPRLSGVAQYTRLSDFTPPSASGGFSLVGTSQPPGTQNPTSTVAFGFAFPLVLNQWLLQATIVIPISDYFLRIDQLYTAATHAEAAARYDVAAARAKSASEGKVSFYTWLRARHAVVVAVQALNDQRTHLNDARNQFTAGNASRADVLRAETAVAAAELQVERSKNLADLTEKQVRLAVHAKEGERLLPGESLDAPAPPVQGNLQALTQEALSARLEVKAIDANAEAARKQATAQRNGAIPSLSAFGDATYANPNQRRFPAQNEWFGTWDVGARITWTPNDILSTRAAATDLESRAAQLEAQKGATRDGIELEVTQAWQQVKEADVALESTKRELASATEAYRVARELFNNGRATSTTLTDAETELTRARLDALNATVDARVARVRLDHALGRDTRNIAR